MAGMNTADTLKVAYSLIDSNPFFCDEKKREGKQVIFQEYKRLGKVKNPLVRAEMAFVRMIESAQELAHELEKLTPLRDLGKGHD